MSIWGTRIKEIRGKRSQAEFGLPLDVDRTTIGSWEIGRHEPDIETLPKIATIGNINVDWLTVHSKLHPFDEECLYYDTKWHSIIDITNKHHLSPQQLKSLLIATLNLHSHS